MDSLTSINFMCKNKQNIDVGSDLFRQTLVLGGSFSSIHVELSHFRPTYKIEVDFVRQWVDELSNVI